MKIDSNFWLKIYEGLDYAPIISTATSAIDLIVKKMVVDKASKEAILKNKYFTYLSNKETAHETLPIVPLFGNLAVFVWDQTQSNYDDPAYLLSKMQETKGRILSQASNRLRNNQEFLLQALRLVPAAYPYVGDLIKHDPVLMSEAVRLSPKNLKFTSAPFILETLSRNGSFLQYLTWDQRRSNANVAAALNNDLEALQYATHHANNVNFVLALMSRQQSPASLETLKTLYNASGTGFKKAWRENIEKTAKSESKLNTQNPYHANPLFRRDLLTYSKWDRSYQNILKFQKEHLTDLCQNPAELEAFIDSFPYNYNNKEWPDTTLAIAFQDSEIEEWTHFWNDEQRRQRVCAKQPRMVRFASPQLLDSKPLMMDLIQKDPSVFEFVSERLKKDPDLLKLAFKEGATNLKFINDRESLLDSVKQNPQLLPYLSETFKDDRSFIEEILTDDLKQNRFAFLDILKHTHLRNDPHFITHLMETWAAARIGQQVPPQNSEEVRRKAYEDVYEAAGWNFHSDWKRNLNFLSDGHFWNNRYFREQAISKIPELIGRYTNKQLKEALMEDPVFFEDFIRKNHSLPILHLLVRPAFWADEALGKRICLLYPILLQFAPLPWLDSKPFIMQSIARDAASIKFASEALRQDREVIQAALTQDLATLEFAPFSVKQDRLFLKEFAKTAPEKLQQFRMTQSQKYLSLEDQPIPLSNETKERLVLGFLDVDPQAHQLLDNPSNDFLQEAIETRPDIVQAFPHKFSNVATVLDFMRINPLIYPFLSAALQGNPQITAAFKPQKLG